LGPVKNGIFYFWIFFNETWHISTCVDGRNLKVSLKKKKKEISGEGPIMSRIFITANVDDKIIL
jgi:hypothetical protein